MTNLDQSQAIALQALTFIITEEPLSERFFALSGLSINEIRSAASDLPNHQDFCLGIIDFLMSHEPDLVAFCSAHEINPEIMSKVWVTLGGQPEGIW